MVNYNMEGRTYRYFHGDPLYPFGYGLSYSTFNFTNAWMNPIISQGQDLTVRVEVHNEGPMDGDEVRIMKYKYFTCTCTLSETV